MERRTFLKRLTVAISGVFGFLLAVPGVAYLIDPRNRKAADRSSQRVARLSELPPPAPDGPPTVRQFVIRDVRRDAWTLHPDEVIGRVWLVRHADDRVVAFTTICPHLGCSINLKEESQRFVCPCHNGTFDLSGERVSEAESGTTNPAPRGMDELTLAKVPVADSDDFYLDVQFQEFRQGLHEQIPKA